MTTRIYDDPTLRAEIDRDAAERVQMPPAAVNLLRRVVEHAEATGEGLAVADEDRDAAVYLRRMALVTLQPVRAGARAVGLFPGIHAAHDLYRAYDVPFWERTDSTHRRLRLGNTVLHVATDGDPAGGRWRWQVEDGIATRANGNGDLTLDAAKRAALECAARVLAAHAAAARTALQE